MYPSGQPRNLDLLVPIDEIINDLKCRMINHEINGDFDRADACESLMEHYMKRRDNGEIYEVLF